MTAPHRRIGIIKPCCIGDAVMSLPVIDGLLAADPATEIEVWCGRHTRAVFEQHPGVAAIVEIPSVPSWTDLPGLARRLRHSDRDGFYVLDRSRLIATACKLAAVRLLGTARNRTSHKVHETDCYLGTLVQSGIEPASCVPSLPFTPDDVTAARQRIELSHCHYVVFHPGGAQNPGATMLSKRWPESSWRELVQALAAESIGIVLTGSPDEVELCRSVAGDAGVMVAAGKLTLMESAAIASSAVAYVGPDTGLTHLAAATGTPTIAIFGPTNPNQYAPRGPCVTILAAPGSTGIASADLRKQLTVGLPTTGEISIQTVLTALEPHMDGSRS